jgi:DNA ligase D-like protein (predicted 3'-phosphoesterase)
VALEKYRKKRKFSKTPEPKGKVTQGGDKPIFVLHEHWAKTHHFDFRLEINGVLKSWAIPKGPPQKSGEKRLAVQVEDHPLEYANFQGIIPEGQYGAGKVEIWDRGKVKVKKQRENIIEFQLFGRKLTGNYMLLKPPSFEAKNWLFIKKRKSQS